jgi:hypothetical protein
MNKNLKMKNNISFFGASITQQGGGYVHHFSNLNTQFKINVFGYGSMHLKDAGICHIDDVLASDPEWCFIDWFSTAYVDEAKDNFDEIALYIDTILHKFYSKGVKLIFLTLPETVRDKTLIHKKINEYLSSKNVPIIDISKSFDSNIGEILRDGIHTTPYGSEQYGKIISDKFSEIYNKIEIPINFPGVTKYCDIKHAQLDKIVKNNITFIGNGEVIGISQIIGPHTGLLRINENVVNNWDRWCYYEREMVNLKFEINGETTIEVLQDTFDTSSCEHGCNWNVPKILKLRKIFYTGNINEVYIDR